MCSDSREGAPLAGALYGVGLWAAGFEGWMPAVGMKAPEHELPPRKWVLPVVSHVVHGVTTAMLYERGRLATDGRAW